MSNELIYIPSDLVLALASQSGPRYHLQRRSGALLCDYAGLVLALPGVGAVDAPELCVGCCEGLAQISLNREVAA